MTFACQVSIQAIRISGRDVTDVAMEIPCTRHPGVAGSFVLMFLGLLMHLELKLIHALHYTQITLESCSRRAFHCRALLQFLCMLFPLHVGLQRHGRGQA